MTGLRHMRYTLRPAGVAAPEAGMLGRTTASSGPDPAALDYAWPDAVALVRELADGWQELEGGHALVFWLPEEAAHEPHVASVLARLARLGEIDATVEHPGWEVAWKAFHRPQVVGRLYVRPPWTPPRDDLLDLAIEAGMAFGTGAHATTRQCLEELQLLSPGALLDLGCGSGVVSLAALRLGFAPVWGIDIDPVAVAAARANAAENRLDAAFATGDATIVTGDATDPDVPLPPADVAVANIALGPILSLASRFASRSSEHSLPHHLLLAGLLTEQREEILAAFPGYRLAAARDDGEWLLLRLEAA